MGLNAKRWAYLKNMPKHSQIEINKPAYKKPKGRRKPDSYRGARCNAYRKEKFNSGRILRKERWKHMMLFGVKHS